MNSIGAQMSKPKKSLAFLSLSFLILALAGCGGGGGGGNKKVTYSGKTSQASVTTTNSGKLTSETQEFGGGLDDAAFPLKPAGSTVQSRLSRRVLDVMQSAGSSVLKQEGLFSASKPVNLDPPISVDGNCGGKITATGTIDDVTLAFDFTMKFNNYCEDGTTISGTMTASGSATTTGDFNISEMTMTSVTISDSTGSVSMNGSISVQVESLSKTDITMNMVIRDNGDGNTVKLENFRIIETSVPGGTSISITGRFFSPDEGFVDVATNPTFFVASGAINPSSGVLLATGSNGSKARLTAIDASQFKLEVDADGDGTFESTTTGAWENLEGATF